MPAAKARAYKHRQAAAAAKQRKWEAARAIDDVLSGRATGQAAVVRLGQAQGALLRQEEHLDLLAEFARMTDDELLDAARSLATELAAQNQEAPDMESEASQDH